MTTQLQKDFLAKALAHAQLANHIFPEFAACEAALESAWGNSTLCREANNVFGQKQSVKHPLYETYSIDTDEYLGGKWVHVPAHWVKFPSWKEAFEARMNTLRWLKNDYPNYALALASDTGEDFVTNVSKSWSTDPLRAQKVLAIHKSHFKDGQIV